jgi:phage shock protein A
VAIPADGADLKKLACGAIQTRYWLAKTAARTLLGMELEPKEPSNKEKTMGVLSRINDIIRSNLNDLVSKAENPEKMLNQAILDMESHLRKARAQVLDTIAAEKLLEHKRIAIQDDARRWERRAEMALRSGDEDLARQALQRKAGLDDHAQALDEQVKIQREYVGALKQSLVALDERMREAKAKKTTLVARAKAARTRKRIAETLSPSKATKSTPESRAFDTFDRMEDKIMSLEAQAEAFMESGRPEERGGDEPALEARFVAMEHGGEIQAQLERLKGQVAHKAEKSK